jgi:Flp pilus assembly protein TadD
MTSPMPSSLDDELRNARVMLEQGRVEEAHRSYARILDAAPENAEALNFLGMHALGARQNARAIELLERAATLDAANPEFPSNLGLAYLAAQKPEQAR